VRLVALRHAEQVTDGRRVVVAGYLELMSARREVRTRGRLVQQRLDGVPILRGDAAELLGQRAAGA